MNYSELQTAVINYFRRSDLTARLPLFIQLAEAYLFRELNIKSLNTSVTGSTVSGLIPLPSDYQAVVRLTMTSDGVERNLDYIASPDDYANGQNPYYYSIEGDSLRPFPAAGTGTPYTLYYTPKIPALSASQTTNWLLDNAQDLYMYATCLQVAADIRNTGEEAKLTPIVERLIDSTRRYSDRLGQPQSSGLQIKVRR